MSAPPVRAFSKVEELTGRLVEILFSSPDIDDENGYRVLELEDGARATGNLMSGVGLVVGNEYRFYGKWKVHEFYGRQFSWTSYTRTVPITQAGIIRYLTDHCDGIGTVTAQRLWLTYGAKAVVTLRETPGVVIAAGIASHDVLTLASVALQELALFEAVTLELNSIFAGYRFPLARLTAACIERWGTRASDIVRRNPYALLVYGMPGASWLRCDRLYLFLGHSPISLKRQMLSAWAKLDGESTGHTWRPLGMVRRAIRDALGVEGNPDRALTLGIRSGWLAVRKDERTGDLAWVAEGGRSRDEQSIVDRVHLLLAFQKDGGL